MRHDDIKQTANTYGHLYTERKQEVMSVFESCLRLVSYWYQDQNNTSKNP